MVCSVIKIEPQGVDWVVQHEQEFKARFSDTAPAVAFAHKLADQLRNNGEAARILVYFYADL